VVVVVAVKVARVLPVAPVEAVGMEVVDMGVEHQVRVIGVVLDTVELVIEQLVVVEVPEQLE
tara:strand:+ start:97 stop:282 length:186 start_codon:yes stop_codon:yes gene_type:complete